MIISIHQPQYIPWIPYFSKIHQSDVFVFLDDVQYEKNGRQNRNYILCKNGQTRLTLPVRCKFGDKLNEVCIADTYIIKKHWRTIEQCYRKAMFFDEIYQILKELYEREIILLSDFVIRIIEAIAFYLGIDTKIIKSSQIEKTGSKSDMILSICKELNADAYITGVGGLQYLKLNDFENSGIKTTVVDYNFMPYHQHNSEHFIKKLSIIDLLFNNGQNSINFI